MASNDPFGWYKTDWYHVRDRTANGLKLNYMWHLRQTYRVCRYAGGVWFLFEMYYQLKLRDGTIADTVKFYHEYEKDKSYGRKERLPPGTTFEELKKMSGTGSHSAIAGPASGESSRMDLFNQPLPNPMTPVVLFILRVYDDYMRDGLRYARFSSIMWWRRSRNIFTDCRNQLLTSIDELSENNSVVTMLTAQCRAARREILSFEQFKRAEDDVSKKRRTRFDELRGAGKAAPPSPATDGAAASEPSVSDSIARLERQLEELRRRVGSEKR